MSEYRPPDPGEALSTALLLLAMTKMQRKMAARPCPEDEPKAKPYDQLTDNIPMPEPAPAVPMNRQQRRHAERMALKNSRRHAK